MDYDNAGPPKLEGKTLHNRESLPDGNEFRMSDYVQGFPILYIYIYIYLHTHVFDAHLFLRHYSEWDLHSVFWYEGKKYVSLQHWFKR